MTDQYTIIGTGIEMAGMVALKLSIYHGYLPSSLNISKSYVFYYFLTMGSLGYLYTCQRASGKTLAIGLSYPL